MGKTILMAMIVGGISGALLGLLFATVPALRALDDSIKAGVISGLSALLAVLTIQKSHKSNVEPS